jgi:hypothetical protein
LYPRKHPVMMTATIPAIAAIAVAVSVSRDDMGA